MSDGLTPLQRWLRVHRAAVEAGETEDAAYAQEQIERLNRLGNTAEAGEGGGKRRLRRRTRSGPGIGGQIQPRRVRWLIGGPTAGRWARSPRTSCTGRVSGPGNWGVGSLVWWGVYRAGLRQA